jgi:hypothetical protein
MHISITMEQLKSIGLGTGSLHSSNQITKDIENKKAALQTYEKVVKALSSYLVNDTGAYQVNMNVLLEDDKNIPIRARIISGFADNEDIGNNTVKKVAKVAKIDIDNK